MLHYDGLYQETNVPATAEYLFSELLETRSKRFDWVIQPHIHARLFQVFFIETGQVTFQEATRERDLPAPVVLLVPPTMVHGFAYHPHTTGRILTLSSSLVDALFPAGAAPRAMLEAVQCLSRFEDPYAAGHVRQLLEEVDQEVFTTQPEKPLMLRACLQRLFLVLFRIWQQDQAWESLPPTPALHYYRRFQQLTRNVGATYNVAQLADELGITPVHLNRICRTMAGKSASQLVQAHLLDEARTYLQHTMYSVSEIAYRLQFEYPNYFAKFFRKHTGQSPTEFRSSQLR